MFAKIIKLKTIDPSVKVETDSIISLICSLKSNGQILFDHILVKTTQGYNIYVSTPKCNSLNKSFDSIYVKRDREKLSKYFSIRTRNIGLNEESQEYCTCKERKTVEMQTFAGDIDSPFTCCDCGKPIPLYELSYLFNQDDHWKIVDWQNTYKATDELWFDSLSDRFTCNQLRNPKSALNKCGRVIASELSSKTGLKVYYNIFDDFTKKVLFTEVNGELLRICPECGKTMVYKKFMESYERYICEDCLLSSDIKNSRWC